MVAGEISADDLRSLGNAPIPIITSPLDDEVTKLGRLALNLIEVGGIRGRLLGHLLGYRRYACRSVSS